MAEKVVYAGIDIGGTNTKIALVDENGEISHLQRVLMSDIEPALEPYLQRVTSLIQDFFHDRSQCVIGIGISSPGLQMNDAGGTLYSVNMPRLNGFDLQKYFSEAFQVPVVTNNDLVAHSLAEFQFGSGRGVANFLSVSLGTGIGHTCIKNGRPMITVNGVSGDSGRMILDSTSDVCDSSGIYGSAEALCGVHGIELLAKERYGADCSLTAYDVIKSARENDETACEIMAVIARRLALLLMNLAAIYFPDLISITGGQTEAGPSFLVKCQEEFTRISRDFFKNYFSVNGQNKDIQIIRSEAGGLAGVVGSVVPLIQKTAKR